MIGSDNMSAPSRPRRARDWRVEQLWTQLYNRDRFVRKQLIGTAITVTAPPEYLTCSDGSAMKAVYEGREPDILTQNWVWRM